jgi:hypothetical protein
LGNEFSDYFSGPFIPTHNTSKGYPSNIKLYLKIAYRTNHGPVRFDRLISWSKIWKPINGYLLGDRVMFEVVDKERENQMVKVFPR